MFSVVGILEIDSIRFGYKAADTIRDFSSGVRSCSKAFALTGPVSDL